MKKVMYNNSELSGSFGQENTPIGTIHMYGGSTLPFGYMWCNGSAVSRTVYADLFNAIGTAFGSGDGSTTFNLPDYRESVPVGAGHNDTQTIVNHDEYTVGQFKDDQFKAHTHNVTIANNSGTPYFYNHTSATTARAYLDSKTYTTSSTGSGDTTHGKQLGCNFIIKFCKAISPAQEQFIDDSTVSAEKTWSSEKIRNDIQVIDCGTVTITNSGNNYGYKQGTIPVNVTTDYEVLGYNLNCGSIASSMGLQYHLIFVGGTTWDINYYRPVTMAENVTIKLYLTVRHR